MITALVQQTEATFTLVPVALADRKDLGCQQLCVFAMRYYREIPKKPSSKDLLARPTAAVDTTKLREMTDLADRLGFESFEITALRDYSKSDLTMAAGNDIPFLVTDGPEEARRDRCGTPHIQSYEEDRRFLFMVHLRDDRNEQAEGITFFFRLRSVYLKFYGAPGSSDAQGTTGNLDFQRHLAVVAGESLPPALNQTRSVYWPRQAQSEGPGYMERDKEQDKSVQIEGAMVQENGEGRSQLEKQAYPIQKRLTNEEQRQSLTSDASVLNKQAHEQDRQRQKLLFEASVLE